VLAPLALVLLSSSPAGPSLRWEAPAGCPDRAYVWSRARRLIGTREPSGPMEGEAIVRRTLDGLTLTVDVWTPSGRSHKVVEADECRVLAEVTALMVALALEPTRVVAAIPVAAAPPGLVPAPQAPEVIEPAPVVSPAVPPVVPPAASLDRPNSADPGEPSVSRRDADPRRAEAANAAADDRARAPRGVEGLLGASFAVGRGLVPGFDGRLAAGAGVQSRRVRAELIAFHVLAQRARYDDLPGVGASVAAWGASARLGPRWSRSAVAAHLLADVGIAAVVAEGFGVTVPDRAADTWIALGLVPGVRWRPTPRASLGLDVEGQVAVRRPAFVLDALDPLHRAARIAARVAVVVEIRLGRTNG